MPTFNAFSRILPDPVYKIGTAGELTSAGSPGPGFAGVNFRSNVGSDFQRTNSGRGVHASLDSQHWGFTIKYNPLTRDEFEPVDSFLSYYGRRKPFYVALPQYFLPRNAAFASYLQSGANLTVPVSTPAGSEQLLVSSASVILGLIMPGDMLTIYDSSNINHLKVYKVVRVETNSTYLAGTTQPTTMLLRLHVIPPIQRKIAPGSTVTMVMPLFRVIRSSNVHEYELNENGLFLFSFDVEEIQP